MRKQLSDLAPAVVIAKEEEPEENGWKMEKHDLSSLTVCEKCGNDSQEGKEWHANGGHCASWASRASQQSSQWGYHAEV